MVAKLADVQGRYHVVCLLFFGPAVVELAGEVSSGRSRSSAARDAPCSDEECQRKELEIG